MALSAEWQFIFAMFLMYGFFFTMYTMSNGAIYGLPNSNIFMPTAPATASFTDWLTGGIGTVISFFATMLLPSPFTGSTFWFMLPINWAILGTTVYLFFRMIRGGG